MTIAAGSAPRPPRLLAQVRATIRRLGLSPHTERAYVRWVRRYIRFHGTRHPVTMGEAEVITFLAHLAVERQVARSTLGQALGALQLLYREVLRQPIGDPRAMIRAAAPARLPGCWRLTRWARCCGRCAGCPGWWRCCSTARGSA
jgi:hypothetical protein